VAKTADPAITGDAAVADFRDAVGVLAPLADAVVLNLSCPNTEDGRTFEDPAALRELLRAVRPAMAAGGGKPLLVKVSPDLPALALAALAAEALAGGAAGFVATNTTRSRDGLAATPTDGLPQGGLSGRPLLARSQAAVRTLRQAAGPRVPIIGCGGVRRRGDVDGFLAAGADLVEAYTGFIYEGPAFCRALAR